MIYSLRIIRKYADTIAIATILVYWISFMMRSLIWAIYWIDDAHTLIDYLEIGIAIASVIVWMILY